MIEIKCGKRQFDRIITALSVAPLDKRDRCVLGKNAYTCPALSEASGAVDGCRECLKQRITRTGERS